ncbi:TatD DNase [Entomortierella beljakovae]|nr:TatD DNase [Entomortierella beljakovae]
MNRARRAGVDRMIITSIDLKTCYHALEIAKDDDGPLAYFDSLKAILSSKDKSKVVAIGECGLEVIPTNNHSPPSLLLNTTPDYDRLFLCPKETQIKYFECQFELAELSGLPMFFHDRNTSGDFASMVSKNRNRFKDGVVHSFTGTMDELNFYLDLGLYISINGCSLKTEKNIKVATSVPLDRLMLETDGPWCEIRPNHASFKHLNAMTEEQNALYKPASKNKDRFVDGLVVRGRNEPCAIGQVLHVLADLHGIDPDELANICYENTLRVFFPVRYAMEDEQ